MAHRIPSSGNIYYYEEDMLGSSRTIVQAGQTSPCFDADFLPFGGERDITSTCSQSYNFEGKKRDPETGNDDFGARYYSSRLSRWLSPDWSAVPAPVPYANLTNPQTLNLYAMVSDNPETFADLDGHCDWCQELKNWFNGNGWVTDAQLPPPPPPPPPLTPAEIKQQQQMFQWAMTAVTTLGMALMEGPPPDENPPTEDEEELAAPAAAGAAEGIATSGSRPSPNFIPPTNPPQSPPTDLPPGYSVRVGGPDEQYPNGYWVETNERNQPVNPATGKPPTGNPTRAEARAQTHVPLPKEKP